MSNVWSMDSGRRGSDAETIEEKDVDGVIVVSERDERISFVRVSMKDCHCESVQPSVSLILLILNSESLWVCVELG